jgi:hypothetical protein
MARMPSQHRGPLGYLVACAIGGVISIALALPAIGAGVLAVKAGVLERLAK